MDIKSMEEVNKDPDKYAFDRDVCANPSSEPDTTEFCGKWDACRIIDAICELSVFRNGNLHLHSE